MFSHSQGQYSLASGGASQGDSTIASGNFSHAEGTQT
jgi:hypothetical protein